MQPTLDHVSPRRMRETYDLIPPRGPPIGPPLFEIGAGKVRFKMIRKLAIR